MHGMLTSILKLHYDNAHLHTAVHTQAPLNKHFNLELFDHLPFSPKLSQSNYHQFTYLKNWLRSQHFNNNAKLMKGVRMWLKSQATDSSHKGIQKTYSLIQVTQFHLH
jgi:hypothetical protein